LWLPMPVALPQMEAGRAERRSLDLLGQAVPAADLDQADHGHGDQAGQDHEELQHLVVDGSAESADRDVDEHKPCCHADREEERPAEQVLEDQGESVEVDPRNQHRGQREGQCVEDVGRRIEPQPEILRDAADLGAVVERHHHQAQEHHGWYGADPVEVCCRDPVLRAVGRHAQDLDRAEVCRDEGQTRDPRRQRPAGQEEVHAGLDRGTGGDADGQDDRKVDEQQGVVQAVEMQPQHRSS